jgi:hypothetical protein
MIFIEESEMDNDDKFMSGKFFRIDMRNGEVWRYPHMLLADEGFNTLACIGSSLYSVGGRASNTCLIDRDRKGHHHTGLSYLDLSADPACDWKGAPNLPGIVPTSSPCVLPFDAKLYVFVSKLSPAAGVYDPILNKWDTLLPPSEVGSFSVRYATDAVADHEHNRILVHFRKIFSTFAYYPAQNTWSLVMENMAWARKLVFLNGVFYFYLPENPRMFNAFHLASKQWLTLEFASEVPYEVWRYEYKAILYLGNGLVCLATYSPVYHAVSPHTDIILAKFRIKRTSQELVLVTPLPLETYTLDDYCSITKYIPI